MAVRWDGFEWVTGTEWRRSLRWGRRTAGVFAPYDLTGAAARLVVRTTDLATALFRLTETDGIAFGADDDPSDGYLRLVVSAARTSSVAEHRHVRVDLAVKLAGAADPRQLVYGNAKIIPGPGSW